MVICCVPKCYTDSSKCDPTVTFHDFPSNPDLAAKWITQINTAIDNGGMWFPRGKSVICSNHFLQTDFKIYSDTLKPRSLPSVFAFKSVGSNRDINNYSKRKNEFTSSPLIVKVLKPSENNTPTSPNVPAPTLRTQFRQIQTAQNNVSPVFASPSNTFIYRPNQQTILLGNSPSLPSLQNVFSLSPIGQPVTTVPKPVTASPQMCISGVQTIQGTTTPKRNYASIKKPVKKISTPSKKVQKLGSDLIEIGPNTFLKINPDIIKVNKKQTPSGNTVLQFIMNQKLASQADSILPKLIQTVTSPAKSNEKADITSNNMQMPKEKSSATIESEKEPEVQHVLGHLVDTHICKDSCAKLKKMQALEECTEPSNFEDIEDSPVSKINDGAEASSTRTSMSANLPTTKTTTTTPSSSNADSSCIAEAPILLTTNVPFSHYFTEQPKNASAMRQKRREVASLKLKVAKLTQKLEELEDRCIVQERQLSYSFIKRLKTIRKNSAKGDPSATYILEQIRGYTNRTKTRWSDTTLTQCAIWCRKAPYAYEYFKKADFFKLPCLGTVKRYIKSHPEIKFLNKSNNKKLNPDDDDSSSDFDFDTESEYSEKGEGEIVNDNENEVACETILSVPSERLDTDQAMENPTDRPDEEDGDKMPLQIIENQDNAEADKNDSQRAEVSTNEHETTIIDHLPIDADRSNLEIQEIILPSGEVVQCISSTVSNGQDIGNQYYIIPTESDQNSTGDHQYSIVQSDSIPVILQNIENSHLASEQQELIFITNSNEQVECSQTEISSA